MIITVSGLVLSLFPLPIDGIVTGVARIVVWAYVLHQIWTELDAAPDVRHGRRVRDEPPVRQSLEI